MPARALWIGQLRLSLVSSLVELCSATSTAAKISLRQIQKPSGKPICYEKTVPGIGPVDLGDIVSWQPVGDPDEGLKDGKLKFTLHGRRMKGGWALVRMRSKEKRGNWLLIKERDEHAGDGPEALTKGAMTSVATGRDMAAIARAEPTTDPPASARRHKGKRPGFRAVQLATLYGEAPKGDD